MYKCKELRLMTIIWIDFEYLFSRGLSLIYWRGSEITHLQEQYAIFTSTNFEIQPPAHRRGDCFPDRHFFADSPAQRHLRRVGRDGAFPALFTGLSAGAGGGQSAAAASDCAFCLDTGVRLWLDHQPGGCRTVIQYPDSHLSDRFTSGDAGF